jgi:hypothetical protein
MADRRSVQPGRGRRSSLPYPRRARHGIIESQKARHPVPRRRQASQAAAGHVLQGDARSGQSHRAGRIRRRA